MTSPSNSPPVGLPDPIAITSSRPSRRRRGIVALTVCAIVALVAGVTFTQVAGSSTLPYRTALVADRDVAAVLAGVGSIEPVSSAAVAFPTAGTVATVDVAVGDQVAAGQQLATIDAQSLTDTLHQRQANLATAQLTLTKALATTTGSTAAAPPASSSSTGATAGTTGRAGGGASSGSPAATAAKQAVADGQHRVDALLRVADAAMASAGQMCSTVIPATPPTGPPGHAPTSSAPTGPTGPTTTVPPSPADLAACQKALAAVADAQAAVATAQSDLATTAAALDALLTTASTNIPAATSTAPSGSSGSTGSAARTGAGSTAAPTSADIIADQSAIDAATADLTAAEQALQQTTIVSPIGGRIAAVGLTVGQAVTAGSTTGKVIVTGPGGHEITMMVSIDNISAVKVGQTAEVVPDGSAAGLAGKVVAIALTPTTATAGSTYRVTVSLDDPGTDLGLGSTSSVTIDTAVVASTLSIPTSAVATDGANHTVLVVDGSKTTTTTVKIGAVGPDYTQITDGLSIGQTVVIANLHQPLPGTATAATNGTTTNQRTGRATTGGPPAGFTPPGR
jgi:RND family efflux transporter MFP subunit